MFETITWSSASIFLLHTSTAAGSPSFFTCLIHLHCVVAEFGISPAVCRENPPVSKLNREKPSSKTNGCFHQLILILGFPSKVPRSTRNHRIETANSSTLNKEKHIVSKSGFKKKLLAARLKSYEIHLPDNSAPHKPLPIKTNFLRQKTESI